MVDIDIGDAHSLGEFMLRRLRVDIINADLQPGTKLVLHDLAKQYGIGITPLRDALGQLAGDGLVVMESQKGFRVAPISAEDLRDLCDIRLRIELMTLDLAFERADRGWDRRIEEADKAFVRIKARIGENTPITSEWEQTHRHLHMTLLSASASPTLMRICGQVYDRLHRYRRLALPTKSYMGGVSNDHLEISKAAHRRDRRLCRTLLESHIVESNRLIEENVNFAQEGVQNK